VKAVIDTNVFVDACLGHKTCQHIIELCFSGRLLPLMGTALFLEFESVLSRDFIDRKSRLSAEERDELLDVFLSRCLWTPIYFGWRPNLPDEADNHLIELAVAGHAQRIVTSNISDLRHGEMRFDQFVVCTPEKLIQEFQP
jgi:putative PIN family toxin of toxin-antitoxin system